MIRTQQAKGTIFRHFFQLLYHQFAWSYDSVAAIVSLGLWQQWVLTSLPFIMSGTHVLELGHGPGHLQMALLSNGIQTVGLDESSQMGRLAFRRILRIGAFPRLVRGYAQYMPFHANCFDHIIATFPSEYIYSGETTSEIYRLLRPGGSLVLIPAAWITSQRWPFRLAAWLFRATSQVPSERPTAAGQLLSAPFERAGFTVDAQEVILNSSSVLVLLAQKPANNDHLLL